MLVLSIQNGNLNGNSVNLNRNSANLDGNSVKFNGNYVNVKWERKCQLNLTWNPLDQEEKSNH